MNDFIKLTLKGQEFTFTALDFEQIQALEGDFEKLKGLTGSMPDATQRASIVAICTASLQFKHPGITADAVAKLLTLANIGAALQAVAGVSALVAGSDAGNA
jgi:hypothetical protein